MNRAALIDELKTIWTESEKQLLKDGYTDAAFEVSIALCVLERTYNDVEKYGIN